MTFHTETEGDSNNIRDKLLSHVGSFFSRKVKVNVESDSSYNLMKKTWKNAIR